MATVPGMKPVKIAELIDEQIVNGYVSDTGRLILITKGGEEIDSGYVGGGGGGSTPIFQVFDFPSPLATWFIVHNLGQPLVDVATADASGNEIFGDVSYPSDNTVQINWGAPMAGKAII